MKTITCSKCNSSKLLTFKTLKENKLVIFCIRCIECDYKWSPGEEKKDS